MGVTNTYIVLTNPVEGREDEFNDWYTNQHLQDILRVPGVISGQRFRLHSTQFGIDAKEAPYRYLAIYEFEGNPSAVFEGVQTAAAAGNVPMSTALDSTNVGAWLFEPVTERGTHLGRSCK
jgi:hypothetical protein